MTVKLECKRKEDGDTRAEQTRNLLEKKRLEIVFISRWRRSNRRRSHQASSILFRTGFNFKLPWRRTNEKWRQRRSLVIRFEGYLLEDLIRSIPIAQQRDKHEQR